MVHDGEEDECKMVEAGVEKRSQKQRNANHQNATQASNNKKHTKNSPKEEKDVGASPNTLRAHWLLFIPCC